MAGIKDAAVRLFASRGYANTSLEDVASAAGFTKGAVYYYFKSKERLLLNVMQDIEGRSIDKTVAAVLSRDGAVPARRWPVPGARCWKRCSSSARSMVDGRQRRRTILRS